MGTKKSHENWTTTEEAILREIWASGLPMRACIDRLPRHSLRAALVRGHQMGLPARTEVRRMESPNKTAMRAAVQTAAHYSLSLAEAVGVSRRTAEHFLSEFHEYGVIHICGWRKIHRNGPALPMFAWGKGEDEPMPKAARISRHLGRRMSEKSDNPFETAMRQVMREAA